MTTKTLDRSRKFGTVYGASDGSMYHQDGCTFNGIGAMIRGDAPQGNADEPPVVTPEPAAVAEAVESEPDVSREQLEALHPAKIKKLVEMAGLELETGPGSKARNIENLLAAG